MTVESVLEAFRALPAHDKHQVSDALRDEMALVDDDLTEELKRELDRRIGDMEENPDDEFSWEDVKVEARRE